MNQTVGEIQMFRLKPLKSNTVPLRWAVVHCNPVYQMMQYMSYQNGVWKKRGKGEGSIVSLITIASMARTAEVTWVVVENAYEWLCSQGFYQQISSGEICLPLGDSSSKGGILTGQFCTGDPTIVDVNVGTKRLHVIDFCQLGIHYVNSLEDGIEKLKDYVRMTVDLEMGSIKSTASAQGGARFRTHDMTNHRIYCHQMPDVRKLERNAFYGGRCEALTLGRVTEPTYHYDAVSMHPTIGISEKFPTKLVDFGASAHRLRMLRHWRAGRHIIAKVRLRTTSPDYPVRMKLPGGGERDYTIYPVGEFETYLCHPEFSHALERNRIIYVVFWSAYEIDTIFVESSKWFFTAKDSLQGLGLAHMKGSLKLCQNSLYGNLGRRGRAWIDTTKWHDAEWGMWWGRHPKIGNVVTHRAIYGVHQYLDSGLEPENSCPAISATMFSYSRIALLGLIQMAGWENTHYYDTDGLVVNLEGKIRLQDTHVNLKLKEEGGDVDIRGIKYYRFGSRWVHAGVPEWAERHEDGSVSFRKHEPFNFGMWHNTPFAHKFILAKNDPHPKYRHGFVGPDGRVSPFELPF
jgi:DNA polymerase type B, organellar and viral